MYYLILLIQFISDKLEERSYKNFLFVFNLSMKPTIDWFLVYEFMDNIRICDECQRRGGEGEEGCGVCGLWSVHGCYWLDPEYKVAIEQLKYEDEMAEKSKKLLFRIRQKILDMIYGI